MRAGEAHERANRFDKAIEEYQRAEAADQPGAAAKIEGVRKRQIAAATLKARTAFAKQDLAGAIKGWDTVLQLDPNNELAKLERQKAVALKQKADALK
jgi:tetratricopeptide (TPR) repeat protein